MVHTSSRASDFSNRDLSIGDVLSKSFGVLSRHLITFVMLSLIVWLPMFGIGAVTTIMSAPHGGDLAQIPPETAAMMGVGMLVAFIWVFLFFPAVFGAIVHVSFQDMRGKAARLGEGFRLGFSRLIPMFAMSILMVLGIMLGMILLVVPGIILALMWYVAFPVCIVEKAGPVESLKRSRALTDGHKWTIFGIAIIVGIASFALPLVPQVLLASMPFVMIAVVTIIQLVLNAYSTVLLVVMYHDLRVVKEGVDIEGIASVFD